MSDILKKIWLLGGWFYITLFFAVAYTIFPGKSKTILTNILFAIIVISAVFFTGREITGRVKDFSYFFRPVYQKLDEDSLGQFSFAGKIKKVLPEGATGCIYLSWDTPTAFLIQQLYPFKFKPIGDDYPAETCGYVISQFKPRPNFEKQLMINYQNNYLYKTIQ